MFKSKHVAAPLCLRTSVRLRGTESIVILDICVSHMRWSIESIERVFLHPEGVARVGIILARDRYSGLNRGV